MNQQKQITLIGMGIIASILMVPIVYAAVEPHIILTMDASQTTAPFTINNNTDYTMFEISPNGAYNNIYSLAFSSDNSVLNAAASNDITDPVILASWVLDRSIIAGDDAFHIPLADWVIGVHIKRDSGVGGCNVGYFEWDGAAWNPRVTAGGSTGAYVSSTDSDGESWVFDDTSIIIMGLYNTDGATTCSYKNIAAHGTITLPLSITISRGV